MHKSRTVWGGIIAASAPLIQYVITTYLGDETLANLICGLLVTIGGSLGAVGIRSAIGKSK